MPRLEGPETCFASDLLTNGNADFGIYVDLFRHNGHSIIISERGVWSVDNNCHMTSCMTFSCKETKSCANDFCYPWSHAYVGETHYYAHPAVGIVAFDTFTNEWKQLSRKQLGFTDLIFGITAVNGSLIVLSRDTVTWSAFDEGELLIENEYQGIGSQNLHLAENGRPLGVFSDGTGFFTFTTNGIMYSSPMSTAQVIAGESIESSAVFRHVTFDTDEFTEVPLSPFVIAKVSKARIAFMSHKGIYQIGRFDNNQFALKPLDPVMNRWFREKLFKCFPYETCGRLRLFYDGQEGWLYVSIAKETYVYDEALVWEFELEEWGQFGEPHRVIGEVNFNGNSRANTGYIAHDNYVRRFTKSSVSEYWFGDAFHKVSHKSFVTIGTITTIIAEGDGDFLSEVSKLVIETGSCPVNRFKAYLASGNGPCFYKENCNYELMYRQETRNCANYYSCSNQGLYHMVYVTALEANEYFAIKTLRVTSQKKGKI